MTEERGIVGREHWTKKGPIRTYRGENA